MAVPSDGSYGVPEGPLSSFPCTTEDGEWSIVHGVEHGEFAQERIDASVAELVEERDAVKELGDPAARQFVYDGVGDKQDRLVTVQLAS